MAAKSAVKTDDAPKAIGPYSQAVEAGNLVFVSGQIPLDEKGQLVSGGVAEQTDRVLRNMAAVLKAARLTLSDVVKTTVYLTDLGTFAQMNEVYARHFSGVFPARATVEVKALPKGVSIEIDAIAVR